MPGCRLNVERGLAGGLEMGRGQRNRKVCRIDAIEEQVHIGDGERASEPVTGRTGMAPPLGSDTKALIFPLADGAATGRDGLDEEAGGEESGIADVLGEGGSETTVISGLRRCSCPPYRT